MRLSSRLSKMHETKCPLPALEIKVRELRGLQIHMPRADLRLYLVGRRDRFMKKKKKAKKPVKKDENIEALICRYKSWAQEAKVNAENGHYREAYECSIHCEEIEEVLQIFGFAKTELWDLLP